MASPRLVVLTHRFPFAIGEEFLEDELPFLSAQFQVELVPTGASAAIQSDSRAVPVGVTVRRDIALECSKAEQVPLLWLANHPQIWSQVVKAVWWDRRTLVSNPRLVRRLGRTVLRALVVKELLDRYYSDLADAVYYSYWLNHNALALSLLRAQGSRSPVLARAHRSDLYWEARANHYQPAQKQIIEGLDHVVCISQHGREYLRKRYPEAQQKLRLSRLGVPPASQRGRASENGRLHIVSCSYLTPVKRMNLLVEALGCISCAVTWTHLGGGALENDLKRQAEHLPPNVAWTITGNLPHSEVLAFYASTPADIFVNVSSSEGVPVSIMEALSYGIPVAATDVGGSSELVGIEAGYRWPADVAPAQIAATLEAFHRLDLEQKGRMRDAAYTAWRLRAQAEVQYSEFVAWLAELSGSDP
jgi:glycosyltransferase involved in cell wall biosynthesis